MFRTLRIPIRKHPGLFALVDADAWAKYRSLGFSESISLDGDGGNRSYVRTMAWLPDPALPRSKSLALARLFVVIMALMLGVDGLTPKGWTVRYKNGNCLDLRRKNLELVPSKGQRNSYHAYWTVHERWKIVTAGGDPNVTFAKRRRAFRGGKS